MDNDAVVKEAKELIDTILENYEDYGETAESGINLIESNQASIDKLEEIFATKGIALGEDYISKMEVIIDKQSKLLGILEVEKVDIFNKMKQIQNKNNVVDNYMNTGVKSIFVDKDT